MSSDRIPVNQLLEWLHTLAPPAPAWFITIEIAKKMAETNNFYMERHELGDYVLLENEVDKGRQLLVRSRLRLIIQRYMSIYHSDVNPHEVERNKTALEFRRVGESPVPECASAT
jgi:hypothetical protein